MFDKRLFALVPKGGRLIAASVALHWLALLAQTAFCFAAAALLGTALNTAGIVTNGGASTATGIDAVSFAVIACACIALCLLLNTAARMLASKAGSLLQCELSSLVFGKLVSLGSARQCVVSDAQATQLMGEGIELLKPYMQSYVPQFVFALLAPVTLFVLLLPVNALSALVMLLCVPLMPVSIMLLMRRAKRFMGSYWGSYTDLSAAFLDAVKGLITLKVFGSDAAEHERLNAQAEEFRQVTMRLLKAQLGSVAFMDLFTYGGMTAGILAAAAQLALGALDVQGALFIALVSGLFFKPTRAFGSQFHTGMNAKPVLEELFALLNAPEPQHGTEHLKTQQLTIEVEGLAFNYGVAGFGTEPQVEGVDLASTVVDGADAALADETRFALQDVSFEIRPNSFIGVVGESGGGKSTLAKLLCGDLSGYEGGICFNGIELAQLVPEDVHRLVTVVSRQSHVFSGSFRSNLMIAAPQAKEPQLWEALRQARMDEYVLSCGGLDALVDAEGVSLSGGQKQRLCFARALLRNTPLYIFDEATSNMDAQSEHVLMEAIQKLALSKSVVVLTHRLSQLKYADEILVMDAGRVAQRGVHAELLRQDGPYARMWESTAELERFAQQVVEELPPQEPSALELALAKMPGMMRNMMTAFASIMQVERYGSGADGAAPQGHPAWIPLPDYHAGISEEGQGECAIEGGVALDEGDASASAADATTLCEAEAEVPEGMGGFMEATLGDLSGDGAEQIRQAMLVFKQNAGKPPQTQVRVAAVPPAKRGTLVIIVKLMELTRSMLPELALSVLLGALGLLAAVGVAAFGAAALLAVVGTGAGMPTTLCVVATALCALLRGPLHYGERLLTHDQTFKTLALVRSKVFGSLRRLAPSKLEQRDAGSLIALLTSDVELLEGFYSRACAPLLSTLALALVMTVVFTALHPILGLLALLSYMLVVLVLPALSTRLTRERGAELRAYAALMTGFMLDSLRGMADLVRFGRADEYQEELTRHMGSLGGGEDSFAKLTALLAALPQIVALLCDAVVFLCAVHLATIGAVPVALALIACVSFAASMDAMMAVGGLGFSLHQTLAAADRVLDILEEKPQVEEVADGVELSGFEGLSMNGAGFGYDGVQVLSDIDLRIEPKSFVGIAGKSGVGKSTLLKLMMRFWDVDAGSVELNGVSLSQINTASLRSTVAYMPQETYLFEGTLRHNLLVARPGASDDELQEALAAAALTSLVERLPQGLETPVSGAGKDLSDGERQRIGLARAFLSGAPLMLLDEPTSNLDALNEAAILRALCINAQGRTVVIVSHRKAVAAIVDKLLVVEDERES